MKAHARKRQFQKWRKNDSVMQGNHIRNSWSGLKKARSPLPLCSYINKSHINTSFTTIVESIKFNEPYIHQKKEKEKKNRELMDFSNKIMALALVILSLSMALPSTLAQVTCEKLDEEECAFAVSSASKRCILESTPQSGAYQCKTSDVVVEKISNHIEMMSCLGACGLERRTVGISSDALMDPKFTQKLCSEACSEHCPNIIDLYSNLASGEGTTLSTLCKKQRANPRRAMEELSSSGAAPGPASGGEAEAPSPSA